MKNNNKLTDTWLKASVLGATWAASEIILGSFLHNLHIPFKGNILTAIGLILLISAAYKWNDKGLFWRSGLICALMKTMSPSAVIFGPMVAIFMEAVLFEISIRMLGRNIIGFVIGSALAMSWVLAQKIANLIIIYGFNIVEIYAELLEYFELQLNMHFDIFWLPLITLLGLYIIFGIITAFIGIKIGKDIVNNLKKDEYDISQNNIQLQTSKQEKFPYSIGWLTVSFGAVIGTLILIINTPVYIWGPLSVTLICVWVIRYKRGMRKLLNPKFWIAFVIITVLSAMLITSIDGNENNWLDGLKIGLEMNTRAALIIMGFTVLGTELYNPKIRNFLANSAYKNLTAALELGFESLPYVIGHLHDAKRFFIKPASVIKLLIYHAEKRINELKNIEQAKVFIVSGDISEGKTTFLAKLARNLQSNDISVGGFYAPRITHNGQTTGYSLVSIETSEQYPFLSTRKNDTDHGIGRFKVNSETLEHAKQMFSTDSMHRKNVIMIDEIGRLELNDKGWKNTLENLLTFPDLYLFLAVRNEFVNTVIEKFNISNSTLLPVSKTKIPDVEAMISHALKKTYTDS